MITLHTFGPAFDLPDPSPFVAKAMMLLKIGSQGEAVEQVQGGLNHAGASIYPELETDGIFGGKTHTRVVEFQGKNGLAKDGLVGIVVEAPKQKIRPQYRFDFRDIVVLRMTQRLEDEGRLHQPHDEQPQRVASRDVRKFVCEHRLEQSRWQRSSAFRQADLGTQDAEGDRRIHVW